MEWTFVSLSIWQWLPDTVASIRNHLDSSNPTNWTSSELKVELEKIGIKITENLSNKQLRRIYLDNKKNSSDNVGSGAEKVDVAQTNDASVNSSGLANIGDTETIRGKLQPPSNSSLTNINLDTDSTIARMNLHGTTPSTSAHVHSTFPPSSNQSNNIKCSLLSNTIALCQQAYQVKLTNLTYTQLWTLANNRQRRFRYIINRGHRCWENLEAVLSVPQFPCFQLQISSQQHSVIQLLFFLE